MSRRALCVGLDDYGAPYDLFGGSRDAMTWARALRTLGVKVQVLRNARATRKAIVSALSRLIGEAAAGDVVVFQYAGHGTRVRDAGRDEPDRYDEALCPIDYSSGALIVDDDLRQLLAGLADEVNFTAFIDCCHSGTMTRLTRERLSKAGVAVLPRFLPAGSSLSRAHREFRAAIREEERLREGLAGRPAVHAAQPARARRDVLFAACQDDEEAYETDGRGDFTACAAGLLSGAIARELTNRQFLDEVVRSFRPEGRQTPRMDCPFRLEHARLLQPPSS